MVYVFDLDDTLYPEMEYVLGGFGAVSAYLAECYGILQTYSYGFMEEHLKQYGRGTVFDALLKDANIFTISLVKRCLSIYRAHKPQINLYKDAINCFSRLKNNPLYIVTDGNKIVQHNKIVALDLYSVVNKVFITHRYGVRHAKPSPYCFEKICALENTLPNNIVYVGDNPRKDFVGIRPLGFRTVRLLRGAYCHERVPPGQDAEFFIPSLDDLEEFCFLSD